MAATNTFKTYERGTRYQTTQAAFTSGMYYTNALIPEGAAKVLANYDISQDGLCITPRRGLQTKKLAYGETAGLYDIENISIVASKVCYQNDKEYVQVIVKEPSNNIIVYTIDDSEMLPSKFSLAQRGCKESRTYVDSEEQPMGVFTASNNVYKIHGLSSIADSKAVGCFVNDQYFFFDKNKKTLAYTQFDTDLEKYAIHELKPQETPFSKAQQLGFNMLLKDPYTYSDTFLEGDSEVATITFHSINAFEDAACTIPAQELIENQQYYYRISYSGKGTLTLTFDWTPTNTIGWAKLSEEQITLTPDQNQKMPMIVIPFRAAASKAILRCTATRNNAEPVDVIWFSFEYSAEQTKPLKVLNNFSLYTATTMTYWQNRLVVAGVEEDKSYLFMSGAELFEYFPFPNNADYLDEPIIAIKPLLDNLLVFTASKLYLYTLDPTIGLTRKCIQTNLNISENDVHLIQIIKNMAYFKSGDYYYMVVPKLNSTTGDLTIAPVYNKIKELFDNFNYAVYDILQEVYDTTERYPLYKVYNYLDYESIHNVYMFKVERGLYINFDLLYNTIKRTWSVYIYQTPSQLYSYAQDATKPGKMLCLSAEESSILIQGTIQAPTFKPIFQMINWGSDCKDRVCSLSWTTNSGPIYRTVYNNKQFIDTGLIDLNSNYKKRFREIQFRVHNISKETLYFNTVFHIDGDIETPKYIYTPIIDDSGIMTLDKTFISDTSPYQSLVGKTKLGAWMLDYSVFSEKDIIKIRVPVSGKGYSPQIKIYCTNEKDYAILDVSNVYRQLYSR